MEELIDQLLSGGVPEDMLQNNMAIESFNDALATSGVEVDLLKGDQIADAYRKFLDTGCVEIGAEPADANHVGQDGTDSMEGEYPDPASDGEELKHPDGDVDNSRIGLTCGSTCKANGGNSSGGEKYNYWFDH